MQTTFSDEEMDKAAVATGEATLKHALGYLKAGFINDAGLISIGLVTAINLVCHFAGWAEFITGREGKALEILNGVIRDLNSDQTRLAIKEKVDSFVQGQKVGFK